MKRVSAFDGPFHDFVCVDEPIQLNRAVGEPIEPSPESQRLFRVTLFSYMPIPLLLAHSFKSIQNNASLVI